MDLVAACEAFVSVAERGSFTRGAAAVGMSQPGASRRIAALERHLGVPLLDRSGRSPALTLAGHRVLDAARQVVRASETLLLEAEEAGLRSLHLAVPTGCDVRELAAVELASRDAGMHLVLTEAEPRTRADLLSRGRVEAQVAAVPGEEGDWTVALGLAGALPRPGRVHLDQLRPSGRNPTSGAVLVHVLPEDDVPHLRDPLLAAAESAGLGTSQVLVTTSWAAALASVLASTDLVMLSEHEARRLDLAWSPLAHPPLTRGYALSGAAGSGSERLRAAIGPELAAALGADDASRSGGRP
ncbi:LysR family transcriptional regulator [Nocardioides mesophilus]|uniref:LysR family transcriptional regulator n=1 Tax=Nocardioides mesophilus TaxID=433659 RepID=A0A7G9RCA0_9ACTN|nr:LysR family transcriptional regulator [Nocardioides mesophilus]QNN53225.1 LysR family transcriptional regulator [Nocardioides mesophilus]